MKVALILSGQFRDAKKSFDSIQKFILTPYQPDVFISSWLNPETIVPSGWFGETPNDDCTVDEIIRMYKPKSITMESFDPSPRSFFGKQARFLDSNLEPGTETKTLNVFSMWYKKHSANQLKIQWERQNDFIYDVVIMSRFDLVFLEDPGIEIVTPGKIRIPTGFDWCEGVADLFAYGDSETMDTYFKLFRKMSYYRVEESVSPTPELINKHHIDRNELDLERWEMKFQIRGVNIWETAV
jgi:hypothetical protein